MRYQVRLSKSLAAPRLPVPISKVVEEIGPSGCTVAVAGLATLVNYFAWAGLDRAEQFPEGYAPGPYQLWSLAGLVLGLVVIGAVAGWRHHPWEAITSAAVVMMGCITFDTGMTRNAYGFSGWDGLPIAGVTFALVGIGALVADWRACRRSTAHDRGWHRRSWAWFTLPVLLTFSLLFLPVLLE